MKAPIALAAFGMVLALIGAILIRADAASSPLTGYFSTGCALMFIGAALILIAAAGVAAS